MRTEKEIEFQKKHEIGKRDNFIEFVLPKHDTRYVHEQIDLQNSRIELLDWVLEQGDFTPTKLTDSEGKN